MTFKFMQPVMTPRGPGYFIAPLTDKVNCQVAIWEGNEQKNPIFRLEDITEAKEPIKARSRKEPAAPETQVVEAQ